jgi:hypothetical protein
MSNFEHVSTGTLLIDFREAEQWLDTNPQGENRSMIRATNRRRRRELLDRGVDLDAFRVEPRTRRLYARRGYVIMLEDGTIGPGQAVHIGRDTCRVINRYEPKWIRAATDEELASHEVCFWCKEDSGLSGLTTEPLSEPQGDSVRTVSGGGFETNRSRH